MSFRPCSSCDTRKDTAKLVNAFSQLSLRPIQVTHSTWPAVSEQGAGVGCYGSPFCKPDHKNISNKYQSMDTALYICVVTLTRVSSPEAAEFSRPSARSRCSAAICLFIILQIPVVTICTGNWSIYVPPVVTICTPQWSLYVPPL